MVTQIITLLQIITLSYCGKKEKNEPHNEPWYGLTKTAEDYYRVYSTPVSQEQESKITVGTGLLKTEQLKIG